MRPRDGVSARFDGWPRALRCLVGVVLPWCAAACVAPGVATRPEGPAGAGSAVPTGFAAASWPGPRTSAEPSGATAEAGRPWDPDARRTGLDSDGSRPTLLASVPPPQAVARFDGTVAPGLVVTLRADASLGDGLRYQWIQTGGTPVALDDSRAPAARFRVPDATTAELAFELVVANAGGIDTASLALPVETPSRSRPDVHLRADAGDDLVGQVGKQVTLNGIRSEPRGRIGFRWMQIAGPPIPLKIEEGFTYTFVPDTPGIYRFVLVVAWENAISEPDEVEVVVGPSGAASATAAAAGSSAMTPTTETTAATAAASPAAAEPSLSAMARTALAGLDDGGIAAALAATFEAVAERCALYTTYGALFSELSRRLEAIVPSEPARRAAWNDRLFLPVSVRVADALRPEGLDLSRPEAHTAPLTPKQRDRLAEQFRALAEGCRGASR